MSSSGSILANKATEHSYCRWEVMMNRERIWRTLSYFPIYFACILLASFLWRNPATLSACYIVLSAHMLARWHTRSDVAYFLLAFTLGPLGEIVAIHFGAWRYTEPTLLIPTWLPLAWGISGLFLKKATEAISCTSLKPGQGVLSSGGPLAQGVTDCRGQRALGHRLGRRARVRQRRVGASRTRGRHRSQELAACRPRRRRCEGRAPSEFYRLLRTSRD